MCGIAGAVHADPNYPIGEERLLAMGESLFHRGPDDGGHYLAPGVGLISRRLAILDLSAQGRMPMSTPDGRYHIVYNGEVYNYRDFQPLLESHGVRLRSHTDTEVVLHLYALEGPAMLDRLNGMFAIAIWDSLERTLFLARDRLGVKPLYYTHQQGAFWFASEQKAFFAAGLPAAFDTAVWEELLCFRFVAGEVTPQVGIQRLLPGHWLLWKDGAWRIQRWWNLAARAQALREQQPKDQVQWFRDTFDHSVHLRRISDVPVGVLLSGGLDSASVAATLALQAGSGAASFTVRFTEPAYDEGPAARQVAEMHHLDYHELYLSAHDLLPRLQLSSWYHDEPLAHASNAHLQAIAEYARSRVTVLLSGEGADEVLGGYVRYQPLRWPALLATARHWPGLRGLWNYSGRLRKLRHFLDLGSVHRHVLFNACDILPADLEQVGMQPLAWHPYREQVLAEAKTLYPSEPVRQAMYSDQHTFLCSLLDRTDRMTMGASIECRVPFLDYRLVEMLAALPTPVLFRGNPRKPLLSHSMESRLPKIVRCGRKWGFGAPVHVMIRSSAELTELVRGLPDHPLIRSGPFDPKRLRVMTEGFLAGQPCDEAFVGHLTKLVVWHDAYFPRARQLARRDRRPAAPPGPEPHGVLSRDPRATISPAL